MSNPVDEAVQRALDADPGAEGYGYGDMEEAARQALGPVRIKHRPLPYINRQRCCVSCWDAKGRPHLWPCPTAPLAFSTEELELLAHT